MTVFSKVWIQHKVAKDMKKEEYMAQSKEQNKFLEANPRETKAYELPDKELKKLSSRCSISSRKQCMNRISTERNIKKNRTNFGTEEYNNQMKKIHYGGLTGRLDQADERISELKHRSFEISQSEEGKKKNEKD